MSTGEVSRYDTEGAIRKRLRRSKLIGRGLAAIAVAAGITLGVSSKNDDVPVAASELALVGTMGAGLTEAVSSRRDCSRIVNGYRSSIQAAAGGKPENGTEGVVGGKERAAKVGRFAFRQVDKILPLNGAFIPMMTYYGSAVVADYARWGGNVLPTNVSALFSPHNSSQLFDPGLAFGTLMVAEGAWMLSSGLGNSENYYQRQLNAADGSQPESQRAIA
jgi:hypothetical protein